MTTNATNANKSMQASKNETLAKQQKNGNYIALLGDGISMYVIFGRYRSILYGDDTSLNVAISGKSKRKPRQPELDQRACNRSYPP
jgi:hypothetical protein